MALVAQNRRDLKSVEPQYTIIISARCKNALVISE